MPHSVYVFINEILKTYSVSARLESHKTWMADHVGTGGFTVNASGLTKDGAELEKKKFAETMIAQGYNKVPNMATLKL